MTHMRRLTALCLTLALLCIGAQSARAANNKDRALTVMTRNLYLGTDFDEIFAAQSQGELLAEVAEAFADVQASNVPARVSAVADEIAAAQPALVSLQEVALWQTGPFDPTAPATNVAFDFLQLLLADLTARGTPYTPLAVLPNFEAEAPAFGPAGLFDVRFTDRLVLLARADAKVSQIKIERVEAHHFSTNLPLSNPFLGDLLILRGWIAADVKMRGKTFRYVNAHLEAFSPIVRFIQANELVQTAGDTRLPIVFAGDFNADATGGDPAYQLLLSTGLNDAWQATHANEPGHTWPLFIGSPYAYLTPSQRLDLVLTRGEIEPTAAEIVGEENVTPARPLPSDHAGVAASLRLLP